MILPAVPEDQTILRLQVWRPEKIEMALTGVGIRTVKEFGEKRMSGAIHLKLREY